PDGYQFIKARSGREALKILLNEFDFALILMDVKMPNLNGFETASLIYEREKLKHIPIIFITANHYGEENIFKGYRMGAVDYIYKPVNPQLLRAKVAVYIDLYKKNQQLMQQELKLKTINRNLEAEIKERMISEEKVVELNRQLLDKFDRLESANKDLDRVAFMASHDLQEPLRKIRMFCDLLYIKNKEHLNQEALHNVERIQKAAGRMQELIKDIFTFTKLSGEEISFVNTNLNESVQEAMTDLESIIAEKKAKIIVDKLPSLQLISGLMRPLFFNLLGNSLKYSKKDVPPVISIHSEIISNDDYKHHDFAGKKDNKYCRIFIQDNGIGFDQQYAMQIFDMFKRLHTNSEFEGTGIGLALCKKIMEKHDGFISALSRPNEGTTFIISFPLKQTQPELAQLN
ncbi:MAG: ATP-binding protein, partial [Bacteroidota bacterium]